MRYLKNLFVAGIGVFLIGWLTSALAIDSTSITPPNVGPKLLYKIVLGQGTTSLGVTGADQYGHRSIDTGLLPCPFDSTPQVSLSAGTAAWVGGLGPPISNMAIGVDTSMGGGSGVVTTSGTYQIYVLGFYFYHITDVSGYGSEPMYHGNYTGGNINWIIYCVP